MTGSFRALLLAAAIAWASSIGAMAQSQAAEESPYRVSEFPVRVAQGLQSDAVISGKWVLWREGPGEAKRIFGKNLETGLEFIITTGEDLQWPVAVDGNTIVATEGALGAEQGMFGYSLPEGRRFAIAPLKGGVGFRRSVPRISGNFVAWAEGATYPWSIYGFNLDTKQVFTITTNLRHFAPPAVSGDHLVWLDRRDSPPSLLPADIWGYTLSTRQEFRITRQTEMVGEPAVSGNLAVWSAQRDGANFLMGYDLALRNEFAIGQTPQYPLSLELDMDGDIVVVGLPGELDDDIFAYDVKQRKQFVVSRAIGNQSKPRISGRTVVWIDARRSGIGKYDYESDIYGARLEPGPAPIPSIMGAPSAADAKIEIVWPHGGVPTVDANKANIGAWLFLTDTLKLAPCQWSPKIALWKAIDNEPARLVDIVPRKVARHYTAPFAIPSWEFNDVDVSAARDPLNKVYFFVTVGGVTSRTSVWAHAADARTYYPQQDVPAGVAPASGAVDAKIEIVWPHGDAPVEQASKVNVGAALFSPGTLRSPPPDWNPTVRLYRSLNNGIGQEVGVGQKRLVQANGLLYPVWDFNDVDVSAAHDPPTNTTSPSPSTA